MPSETKPVVDVLDRLPPMDIEAEEAVLAACLVDAESTARCAAMLTPRDFFREKNGEIFAGILRVYASGSAVDPITIAHELSRKNELKNCGGLSGLIALTGRFAWVVGPAAESYAEIVRAEATKRAVIQSLASSLRLAYEDVDVETLMADAEASLNRVRSGKRMGGRGMDAEEAVKTAADDIVQFLDDPRRLRGFQTPWWRLDFLLDGMVKGRLITWGAATSVGKSLAVQNVTRDLALAGIPVLMFTTEMTPEEVVDRLAGMHAGVDKFVIRHRGHALQRERDAYYNALEVVRRWPIRFEPGEQTPASIRAKARLYRDLMGVEVVIVDHIGQGFVRGEGEREVERIGHVTSGLKNLAADEDLVVLAVSHVNRDSRREKRLLQLRDLYGSEHIPQDSSQVVLLTPVKMAGTNPMALDDQEATAIKARDGGVDVWFEVAKNRFGATGGTNLFLSWAGHGGRFVDQREREAAAVAPAHQGELVTAHGREGESDAEGAA